MSDDVRLQFILFWNIIECFGKDVHIIIWGKFGVFYLFILYLFITFA